MPRYVIENFYACQSDNGLKLLYIGAINIPPPAREAHDGVMGRSRTRLADHSELRRVVGRFQRDRQPAEGFLKPGARCASKIAQWSASTMPQRRLEPGSPKRGDPAHSAMAQRMLELGDYCAAKSFQDQVGSDNPAATFARQPEMHGLVPALCTSG